MVTCVLKSGGDRCSLWKRVMTSSYLPAVAPVGEQRPRWQEALQGRAQNCSRKTIWWRGEGWVVAGELERDGESERGCAAGGDHRSGER